MFKKILIANRGEISCRIMQTCWEMGISTVAVYSDADAGAKHVADADEAVHIGPAAASLSYLDQQKIIDAALATGAEAIHPGYGFLSENPEFVDAVESAGLTFIGPSAEAIRAMGLKDAAKRLMIEAGVPVVPGYHSDNQDPAHLSQEASKIGFPVLIKARAGGGGKGMRLVENSADFDDALSSARREAEASFGDGAVLIEKYIQNPRHIEMQVFGDSHGNVVHLFERDCSLQRRHQKVIEEAPAPGMTPDVRAAMGDAAVRAAQAIDYAGAGTIEFIVDASNGLRTDGFWFMEMNTRLQVEHPVTELITGQDLVEWQIRVAVGERLPQGQHGISINGHAMEARIYAEDAARDFLPVTGKLAHVRFPKEARADTGVRSGDSISPFYDPMIAKLIVHSPDRETACNRLSIALKRTEITGTATNLDFLIRLAEHPRFRRGDVETGLIGEDQEALTTSRAPSDATLAVAAVGATGLHLSSAPEVGFTLWSPLIQTVSLMDQGQPRTVRMEVLGPGHIRADPGGGSLDLKIDPSGAIQINGELSPLELVTHSAGLSVFGDGGFDIMPVDPLAASEDAGRGGDCIIAPMSGVIRDASVVAGDTVTAGQPLIVMEAMKMEHGLTAPRDGKVETLKIAVGDQVSDGDELLTLAPE